MLLFHITPSLSGVMFMKFILPNMWCCHRSSLSGFMFAFLGVALKKRCLLLLTSVTSTILVNKIPKTLRYTRVTGSFCSKCGQIDTLGRFQTCNKRDFGNVSLLKIICEVGQGEGCNLRLCHQLNVLNHHVVYCKIATLNGLLLHLLDTYIIVYIPSSLHYWLANLNQNSGCSKLTRLPLSPILSIYSYVHISGASHIFQFFLRTAPWVLQHFAPHRPLFRKAQNSRSSSPSMRPSCRRQHPNTPSLNWQNNIPSGDLT